MRNQFNACAGSRLLVKNIFYRKMIIKIIVATNRRSDGRVSIEAQSEMRNGFKRQSAGLQHALKYCQQGWIFFVVVGVLAQLFEQLLKIIQLRQVSGYKIRSVFSD